MACDAFLSMQKAAAADGVTVWMQSGYRSVSYQTNLYEKKTNYYKQQGYDDAKAKEMAAAIVNPPGYSEHNCGLAADLNSPEHTGGDEGFEISGNALAPRSCIAVCGGGGSCGSCNVILPQELADAVPPMTDQEKELLDTVVFGRKPT